jgi:hypothetical protein
MPDWMVKLWEQWAVVTTAPLPFAIAILGAATAISLAVGWSYRGVLSKRGQIDRRSNHSDKPAGATQETGNADIDTLKRMVASTIGSRWTPLNDAEIAALSAKLTDIPKIRVQIMYDNALGKELAQSFHEAFKRAGWEGATLGIGSGLEAGVTIGQGSGTATIALRAAIEAASRIKVAILKPEQPQWPGVVSLAVGVNSIEPSR